MDNRSLRLDWVTPDGVEQAWFIELGDGPFPDIPSNAEILETEGYPEIEPAATVRVVVTSWSAPVPAPILWGGGMARLMGLRERQRRGWSDERGRNPLKWDEW